jgi:hypothetical protein
MKQRIIILGLLLGLAVLAPAAGAAEPAETADEAPAGTATPPEGGNGSNGKGLVTQDELEGVRAEIQTLSEQWRRSLDKSVVQSTRSLKFGGFAQGRYTVTSEGNDNFEIPLFVLNLAGSLRRDYTEGKNLDYFFSLSSNSKNFNVTPLEARLTYSVFQSLDKELPFLTLTFGQQKKPISLEAQASEEFKPTIRSAQFATNLGLDPRDIGLVLRGDLFPAVDYGFNYRVPLIEYSIGLINGSGPNAADDNNDKDVVGRLVINAPVDYNSPLRGLSIGGSYYAGRKSATRTYGTGAAATTLSRKGAKDRWEADIAYVNTPVGFTFEYVRGDDAVVTGSTAAQARVEVVKSEGFAGTIFYNLGDQFVRGFKSQDRYDDWYPLTYQPFVRFDRWTPDIKSSNTRTDIWTAGFNWFFAETTKLQLNYNYKRNVVKGVADRNEEFLVQFQFGF